MESKESVWPLVMALIAVLGVGMGLGLLSGVANGRNRVHIEAVKAGVARWVPNESGKCTLEWIKEGQK